MNAKNVRYAVVALIAVSLLLAVVGNAAFLTVKDGGKKEVSNSGQIQKDLGSAPIAFEPKAELRIDNRTHVVFLYYTTCPACEDDKNLFITKSFPTWQGNVTDKEISFDIVNYYRKKDIGEAYFKAFDITQSQFGGTILVIHNSRVGLVYYPPFDDAKIQKAVYYTTRGSIVEVVQRKSEARFSQPLVFALGAVSGFNPCLIALASFFFATATKTELKGVARRITLISLGLIYAYVVLFSLIASNPVAMGYLASLTWVVVVVFVALGLLHFVEVAQDVYSRKWGGGSSIDAMIPVFKTPESMKRFLARVRELNSPVYDFALGALFSLAKLPCIAVFLIVLLVNSVSPLLDIIIFTLGVASPIIVMGALIGVGMIKVNRLSTVQFKGRLIQRLVIGAALIVSAILVVI